MLMICSRLEDIDWSGDNIKVMGHVTVTPPYKPDNVRGVSDSKAVMHVRKIVSMPFLYNYIFVTNHTTEWIPYQHLESAESNLMEQNWREVDTCNSKYDASSRPSGVHTLFTNVLV